MRIKMPAVRIAQDSDTTEPEMIQDILTCGSCMKKFVLSDILLFIDHKVAQCNKENYGPCFSQSAGAGDRDSDDGRPLSLVNRRPSISAPIGSSRKASGSRVHTPPPASPAELQIGDGASSTPKRLGDETDDIADSESPANHPASRDSPNTANTTANTAKINNNNNETSTSSSPAAEAAANTTTTTTTDKVPSIKEEQMEVGSNHDETEEVVAAPIKAPKRPRCDVEVSDAESNTVNSEPSNYVCSTCKVRFQSAWRLVQHVQHAHGVKIYVDLTAVSTSSLLPGGTAATGSLSSHHHHHHHQLQHQHLLGQSASASGLGSLGSLPAAQLPTLPTHPMSPMSTSSTSSNAGHSGTASSLAVSTASAAAAAAAAAAIASSPAISLNHSLSQSLAAAAAASSHPMMMSGSHHQQQQQQQLQQQHAQHLQKQHQAAQQQQALHGHHQSLNAALPPPGMRHHPLLPPPGVDMHVNPFSMLRLPLPPPPVAPMFGRHGSHDFRMDQLVSGQFRHHNLNLAAAAVAAANSLNPSPHSHLQQQQQQQQQQQHQHHQHLHQQSQQSALHSVAPFPSPNTHNSGASTSSTCSTGLIGDRPPSNASGSASQRPHSVGGQSSIMPPSSSTSAAAAAAAVAAAQSIANLEPQQMDFYSQRLRQLAGTTSPGQSRPGTMSSPSSRKQQSPPFASPSPSATSSVASVAAVVAAAAASLPATSSAATSPAVAVAVAAATALARAQSQTPPEPRTQLASPRLTGSDEPKAEISDELEAEAQPSTTATSADVAPSTTPTFPTTTTTSAATASSPQRSESTPPKSSAAAVAPVPASSNSTPGTLTASNSHAAHPCEFCGKKFRFASNLIVHRRAHTGDKEMRCSCCAYCTQSVTKLKMHMRMHSAGAIPTDADRQSNAGSVETFDGDESGEEALDEDDDCEDIEEEEEEDIDEDDDEDDDMDECDEMEDDEAEDLSASGSRSDQMHKFHKDLMGHPSSLVSELMDKFGLSNIAQYSEAYKQALQESSGSLKYHLSGKDHDNNNSSLLSAGSSPPLPHQLATGSADKLNGLPAAALRLREEFAKNMLQSQQANTPSHQMPMFNPFENPFDSASKRLKLEHHHHQQQAPGSAGANDWWNLPGLHRGGGGGGAGGGNAASSMDSMLFESFKSGKGGQMHPASASMLHSPLMKKDSRRNDTCEYCGKVFKNCSNLTVHRRSHTGEKPYKCELCSYACAQSSKLTRHMKTHGRMGKDVYRCRFCDMPFSVPSTLEKHMRKCVVNQGKQLAGMNFGLPPMPPMKLGGVGGGGVGGGGMSGDDDSSLGGGMCGNSSGSGAASAAGGNVKNEQEAMQMA